MSDTTQTTSQAETKNPTPSPAPDKATPAPEQAIPSPAAAADEAIAAAKKEAAANHERYLRAVADLENFRKRTVREKDELRQFATSGLMEDLIPVLDNLGLGLAAAKQQPDVKGIVEGVSMVIEQLKSTLARNGLKEVNPAGATFDPALHESIAHQPSDSVPEEKVIQVVRLGYTLNGRLLRPASVIVSSGPAKTEAKA